jgi:hypothetical protein
MYFLALLVASTAGLLASVSSELVYVALGLIIAAVMVLWAHQPISRMTAISAVLLALAFIVPATLVEETFSSARCVEGVPCDPLPNNHPGLRIGIAAVVLLISLVVAVVGLFRSSRIDHAPLPRRRTLA